MKILKALLILALLTFITSADAMLIDCSGLPKSHTVRVNINTASDGASVVADAATTERAGTSDSNYYYDFTTEVPGTTYVVECLDATDLLYTFSWTLTARETFVDAATSTRSTYAGGAVASVTGAVGSVTAGVTVTTNNDKTGYTVSTVSDKTGYALTSAYDPAKTAAQASTALSTNTWTNNHAVYIANLYDQWSDMVVAIGETDWQFDSVALALGPTETISLQDVRDAMKLAPSVGDPALNSIDERLSALYNPLYGLEMIEEKLDTEVAAPIANVTYGLSALQVLLDAIATSSELTAMFDAIKGVGWTNETLKAIKDAIGSGGISAQQVRDAMKLPPTAGDPATGSIDKKLNNIERHN